MKKQKSIYVTPRCPRSYAARREKGRPQLRCPLRCFDVECCRGVCRVVSRNSRSGQAMVIPMLIHVRPSTCIPPGRSAALRETREQRLPIGRCGWTNTRTTGNAPHQHAFLPGSRARESRTHTPDCLSGILYHSAHTGRLVTVNCGRCRYITKCGMRRNLIQINFFFKLFVTPLIRFPATGYGNVTML
jgi:hypothetical protein